MDIIKMTAQELILLEEFSKLANEALDASNLIFRKFETGFGPENKEIHVYHTETFGEYYGDGYLTIDGIFRYRDNWWGGREYSFPYDMEGIYKMLRSAYLRKNYLAELDPEEFTSDIPEIDRYFRDFIKELKEAKAD